jgi:monovalent cation:H+ antiporter-2, CPA2 family
VYFPHFLSFWTKRVINGPSFSLSMIVDPLLPILVFSAFFMIAIGLVMRILKQPHVIGYILVGVILGPAVLGLLQNEVAVERLGSFGIVLLLFFIGMHVSIDKLVAKWRVAIIGTLLQILITVGVMFGVGYFAGWSVNRSILLGFVVSLSSTAVVLKILEDRNELDTNVGQNALSILLVQDLAIIPMIIIVGILSGEVANLGKIALETVGGIVVIGFISWLIYKGTVRIPFREIIMKDHEIQLFVALLICFGLSLITGLFGLSTALGAFVAGILVAATKEETWIQKSLRPFYIVFVALFFIYVGLSLDVGFIIENYIEIFILVLGVFILNTAINSVILRSLGNSWKEAIYAAALLAQIGEFSFLLGAIAFQAGMVSNHAYQLIIATIALTLFFSPLWISVTKRLLAIDKEYVFALPGRIKGKTKQKIFG